MIKNSEPLSMSESLRYLHEKEGNATEVKAFIKKFPVLEEKELDGFEKKLEELGMIKLQKEHFSKIIDFLPEDAEDLNKLFNDLNFDEDEAKKILDVVREFK